jgi:nicotinamidase-related amidase
MRRNFNDHVWNDVISAEGTQIYESFQRDIGIVGNVALLAVDLYNIVYRGGPKPPHELTDENPSACGIYAWDAIEPTKQLFAEVRAAELPVFYSTATPAIGGFHSKNRPTNRQVAGAKLMPDDYEIRQEFTPQRDDVVLCKERASAFFGTPLISHLVRLGIDTLVVCGESTSGCVRASVIDAFSYGFNTLLVEECVFDRYDLIHKINMFDMHHKYAGVMSLEAVTTALRQIRKRSESSI